MSLNSEPLFIFVTDQKGVEHKIPALSGWRIMEIIRDNDLPIKAECGGCCSCATCHIYVSPEWMEHLETPRDDEIDMLDEAFDVEDNSRLSCQVLMHKGLNGLKVTLAPGTEG